MVVCIIPFHANSFLLCPLKIPKKRIFLIFSGVIESNIDLNPENIRLGEDVLKTSSV